MRLNFLNNGIDSLKKGFENLNKYESIRYREGSHSFKDERFYYLKDSILFIQHGIEILIKSIINKHSEYLIFSQIDSNVKKALKQKKEKNLNSVFESDFKNKIHTVTFLESIERLKVIPSVSISKSLEKRLIELESYRNIIMHSEPYLNESIINETLDGLSDDLDVFFIENIGKKYKTISGYSSLLKNMTRFKKTLKEKELELKSESVEIILRALRKSKISIGSNEIKRITNINACNNFLTEIFNSKLSFGTDLYNGFCSGQVTGLRRKENNIFEFFTNDNYCFFEFKLKSIIIYIPTIVSDESLIIFIESDNIDFTNKDFDAKKPHEYDGIKYIEYYLNKATNTALYIDEANEEIDVNYENFDDYVRFLTKGLFCFINIQGLKYNRNYARIIEAFKLMDGKKFEVELREILKK